MSAASLSAPLIGLERRERPLLRLPVFLALAVLGSLQYAALLNEPPRGRLLAVVVLVTSCSWGLLAGIPVRLPSGARQVSSVLFVVVTFGLALLALGVPAHMIVPAGWGDLIRHLGHGIERLGRWPYQGMARWARLAVLLVLPLALLLAGALCFWPGDRWIGARRTGALALLVGLFATGAANAHEYVPGLRGLMLLALIAAWLWLPSLAAIDVSRAARWLILSAAVALVLRGGLSSSHAWIGEGQARAAQATTASFQWDQTYGPITWSRSKAVMFRIVERRPELVRATSLDRFDGIGFLRSPDPPGSRRLDLAARDRSWYAHATVTVIGLRSNLLLSAGGEALSASWLSGHRPRLARQADGTLTTQPGPGAGGLYSVRSYAPDPSVTRLQEAPRAFPRAYLPYAQFQLPGPYSSGFQHVEQSAALSAATVGPSAPGLDPAADRATVARIDASPYAPMFALAHRLARGAADDYDVARRIESYLLSHYTYDEHVPRARYPLEAFLFSQRRGYCQQFSGAMALMLRMDGIPARVAAGFKPVLYDSAHGSWQVRAFDAHAWVEVFFSGIGWVSFDPTPAASGATPVISANVSKAAILGQTSTKPQAAVEPLAAKALPSAGRGRSGGLAVILAGFAGALLLLGAVLWLRGRLRLRRAFEGDADGAATELRRAMSRLEQASQGATLSQLERRLLDEGQSRAAGYVRGLRELRYGPAARRATVDLRGRAALRRALRHPGVRGWATALLALPPGMRRRGRRS
jgi:protein-glutamine gamma-glutamyltransferase